MATLRLAVTTLGRSYGWFGRWFWPRPGAWRPGRVLFWLLQRERDRDADELEGLPLVAGGLGEHRHGEAGARATDLVAGQGGQVVQQAAEAAVGAAGRIVLAGGLGLRMGGSAGGGDRAVLAG